MPRFGSSHPDTPGADTPDAGVPDDVEARWVRAGRPWCSHPWAVRVRRGERATGCLSCQLCGVRWGRGGQAPAPRGRPRRDVTPA